MWRRIKILLSYLIPAFLLAGFATLWICRFNQWDSLASLTVIPFWIWAVPGIIIGLISAFMIRTRFSYLVLAIWFLTALFTSAEAKGLWRSVTASKNAPLPSETGKPIKLATINCNGGNLRAAHEAIAIDPDIILLQEAPDRDHLEELTKRIFGEEGSFVVANSNAIIGRGKFLTFGKDESSPTIHARFKHANGTLIDLTNVKLSPSIPEKGFWKASVRERLRLTRIKNRKSVREVIESYKPNHNQPIRVVAGDFSTPPGDDIFRPLRKAGLRDAFEESGRGAGNTFPGKFPFLRLDQIWVSEDAHLVKTYTRKSEYSDHEIVICEFMVTSKN